LMGGGGAIQLPRLPPDAKEPFSFISQF